MNQLALHSETSRCLFCHEPPCSQGCPQNIDPGKILRSIHFDNLDSVRRDIDSCISCGSCEERCLRKKLDGEVRIADIFRHVQG